MAPRRARKAKRASRTARSLIWYFIPLALATLVLLLLRQDLAYAQGPLAPQCPNNVCGNWIAACYPSINDPDSLEGIHAALLHTGKVIYFGYGQAGFFNSEAWLWTPGSDSTPCGTWEAVPFPFDTDQEHDSFFSGPLYGDPSCIGEISAYSPFCGGHDFDRDGRLLVASGIEDSTYSPFHDKDSFHTVSFDPTSLAWTARDNLEQQRWYPTVRIHPNTGDMYTWDGTLGDQECWLWPAFPLSNTWPEVLGASLTGTWQKRLGPGSPPTPCHPPLAAYAPLVFAPGEQSTIWPDPATRGWWLAINQIESPDETQRPVPYVIKTGTGSDCAYQSLVNRPNRQHRDGPFVIPPFGLSNPYNPSIPGYLNGPNLWMIGGFQARNANPECGSYAPHDTFEVFSATTLAWTHNSKMNYARQDHNAILLPDSTILVVGGGKTVDCCGDKPPSCGSGYTPFGSYACGQLTAEIFDPAATTSSKWRKVDAQVRPRLYHSTALLLPNGNVLSAGGEWPTTVACDREIHRERSIEVYKPPYAFDFPARPVISDAPSEVGYGGDIVFSVQNWDPGDGRVMLIRPGSVTHSHEMAQRTVYLPFSEGPGEPPGSYNIAARVPARNEDILPPGWYMLWVVRDWVGPPTTNNIGKRQPCTQAAWVKITTGGGFRVASPAGDDMMAAAPVPSPTLAVVGRGASTGASFVVDAAGGGPNQLTIYDVTGRQVAMVAKGLQGRVVEVTWNGRDERGMLVASGVYFARLTGVGESTRTEKFVIVR